MGLGAVVRRWLGTETIAEDRLMYRQLIGEISEISRRQVEVTLRTVQVLEAIQNAYAVSGPPVGRHINDELEAEMFEEHHG